jgi:hypothetical protein
MTAQTNQEFISLSNQVNNQLNLLTQEKELTIKKCYKTEKVDFEAGKNLITKQ